MDGKCNQGRMVLHDDNEEELLKRRISSHLLYGLLVDSHLDCLEVGLGNIDEIGRSRKMEEDKGAHEGLSLFDHNELDQFMEAYCIMLNKLKGAMEEPQQETMAFINSMRSELEEIMSSPSSPVSPVEEAFDVKLREPDH